MDRNIKLIAAALLVAATASAQDAISPAAEDVPLTNRIDKVETNAPQREIKGEPASVSQSKYAWRYCRSKDALIVIPFFSNGETWTRLGMTECPTLADATNQIARMKLRMTAEQRDAIAELREVGTGRVAVVEVVR